MKNALRILALLTLAFLSFLMLRLIIPYLALREDVDFLRTKQGVYYLAWWRVGFYIHVFSSILTLVAGFTQFSGYILRRYKRLHRVMGYTYVLVVVFVTGPASFVMAFYANGGLAAKTSFFLLSVGWMVFTAMSWYYAVRKRFVTHGAFMFRSYALTLSALTLRTYSFVFVALNMSSHPKDIYVTTAWLGWVPNLLIAEWLIQAGKPKALISRR